MAKRKKSPVSTKTVQIGPRGRTDTAQFKPPGAKPDAQLPGLAELKRRYLTGAAADVQDSSFAPDGGVDEIVEKTQSGKGGAIRKIQGRNFSQG
jgi:hypothetical protein